MTTIKRAAEDPLKKDFRNFLFVVWQHLGLSEPTVIQYDIARYLQHGPDRSIICAFRGVGKSWVTIAYVAWLLYCDPQVRVLVVSASQEHAVSFTTMLLRLVHEMALLKHLRPRDDQRSSKLSFDVGPARAAKEPSVKSLGIGGQLTGSRADVIIPDDIETATNSATQGARDLLKSAVKEFANILKPDGLKSIKYLGTPHIESSLYNHLVEQSGYTMRIWPARYPDEKRRIKYCGRLAPLIGTALDEDPELVGKPTDRRFQEDALVLAELENGRSGFALQFMLDTSLADADRFPLRLRDLIVLPLDGTRAPLDMVWGNSRAQQIDDAKNVGIVPDAYYAPAMLSEVTDSAGNRHIRYEAFQGAAMAVDPSGKGKDETGYAVVKMLNGRLFLTASGGLKGGYTDEVLDQLLRIAKRHGVNTIVVEPNMGAGMFAQLMRSRAAAIHPCSIEDGKWSKARKEERIIDTLEPVMNQHRLVVDKTVIDTDFHSTEGAEYGEKEKAVRRLFYQMTRITREKNSLACDDRIDALAQAVAHWLEVMSTDAATAAQQHESELLEAELERFVANCMGRDDGQLYAGRTVKARGRLH